MPTLTLPGIWQSVLDAFLSDVEARSGSVASREKYSRVLRLFFTETDKSPDAYTRREVDAYLRHGSFADHARGAAVSVSTRNGRLCILNSFFNFAIRQGVIAASPSVGFRYHQVAVRYRAMDQEELARFFAAIPTDTPVGIRDRALFWVLWATARRHAEITRLTWGDIESSAIVDGHGQSHTGYIYRCVEKGASRSTKTRELPASAYTAIVSFLTRMHRFDTITPTDVIFTATHPGPGRRENVPISQSAVTAHFRQYRDKAGLKDARNLTVHSLRHSASLIRYTSGQDIVSIKSLLGHKNLQTTDIYLQQLTATADTGTAFVEKLAHLGVP